MFTVRTRTGICIDAIQHLEPYGGYRLTVYLHGVSAPFISSTARTPELRKWLG